MVLMNHTLSKQKKCCVGREEKKSQPVNGDGMWDQVCNRNNQRVTLMDVKLRPWVLTIHYGHRLGVIQPRHVCVVHLQQPNPKLIKNHSPTSEDINRIPVLLLNMLQLLRYSQIMNNFILTRALHKVKNCS
jgi:hypothetical protein